MRAYESFLCDYIRSTYIVQYAKKTRHLQLLGLVNCFRSDVVRNIAHCE